MIVIILEFAYPLVIRLQIRKLYITQQILGTDTQKRESLIYQLMNSRNLECSCRREPGIVL